MEQRRNRALVGEESPEQEVDRELILECSLEQEVRKQEARMQEVGTLEEKESWKTANDLVHILGSLHRSQTHEAVAGD